MLFDVVTLFPGLFDSALDESIIKRARQQGLVEIGVTNIRDFATDRHATTDDRPFGGGEGMVMKADPLAAALRHSRRRDTSRRVVLLTPQGRVFSQALARELADEKHIALICGRYEGVDERFCRKYVTDEISIGDFILTGGELGALVIIDAVTRLLPGVLGCPDSAANDSFSRNLLKHPQYTRPRDFEGMTVPDVLLSGDHQYIADYRFIASVKRTLERRPDLLLQEEFSPGEIKLLRKCGMYKDVKEIQTGPRE